MIAVDVLEVPLSATDNRYLLVAQDYYTKWADAIPLPDQTAACITGELVHISKPNLQNWVISLKQT